MARTLYSASVRLDENNAPTIDATKLSAAAKYYRRVDPTGEYAFDALFEDAWVRFMAGDYVHALGNLRVLSSPELAGRNIEGAVLEAVILFSTCRYDEATAVINKLKETYGPRRAEIERALEALDKMGDDAVRVQFVRSGAHGVVADVLASRALAAHLEYDAFIESEVKRLRQAPASFRAAKVADDVQDDLALAGDIERRNIADLAKQLLLRERDQIAWHLRDALKVLIDITAAQRDQLESPPSASLITSPPAPKPMQLSWPINGQAALLDPYGLYRTVVTSKCGR